MASHVLSAFGFPAAVLILAAVLAGGAAAAKMKLTPPPATPPRLPGKPSPVVLQAVWPKERVALSRSAYRLSSKQAETIPVYAYNFSDQPVEGTLGVAGPEGWHLTLPRKVAVAAGDRAHLELTVDARGVAPRLTETVRIAGDFGPAGRPVLSLAVMPEPRTFPKGRNLPVPGADRADRWVPQASGGSSLTVKADGQAMLVEATLGGGDRWVYPRMELADDQRPPPDAVGVQATLTLLEGEAVFRTVFTEANGSGYAVDFVTQPERGKTVETVALFADGTHGAGWSKPDANGRLDVAEIRTMAIGCNPTSERMRYRIERVRWLRAAEAGGS
ncbi:MAG TPA: hypothetical protein VM431_01190 [Phycisphaerae bacterium]|nr:hypothetical protein [Phycisphaerae bacterium]